MRSLSQSNSHNRLDQKYDAAAPGWADKMRLLGYFDAYLGFLSTASPDGLGRCALDVGCGTGAFAEARAALHPTGQVTLLEPSGKMLQQATHALAARGVKAEHAHSRLEDFATAQGFDCILAAHVLEHCDDPVDALRRMRELAQPRANLWLVVSKPHWCNAIIWFQWRHQTYRPAAVRQMLSAARWELQVQHSFPAGPPSRTSMGYKAVAV